MALYNEKIGEMPADSLIASTMVRQITQSVTVVSGAGALKRGTVLSLGEDGKASVLADDMEASCILCDDVDATDADAVAEVYVSGCFHKQALIVSDGYALTAANIQELRNGGIYIENMME